jgi:hypothetical protein
MLDSEDHVSGLLASSSRLCVICLSALAMTLAGCGGTASRPQYQVRGKVVTKDGKPAVGALVVLHPVNRPDADRFPPRATAGKDGVFVVGGRLAGDGAPEGDYDVTLIWPEAQDPRNPSEDTPPDRLKKRYDDVKHAKWHVHVKAGDNALEPFIVE